MNEHNHRYALWIGAAIGLVLIFLISGCAPYTGKVDPNIQWPNTWTDYRVLDNYVVNYCDAGIV